MGATIRIFDAGTAYARSIRQLAVCDATHTRPTREAPMPEPSTLSSSLRDPSSEMSGVRLVTKEFVVQRLEGHERRDAHIASEAARALSCAVGLPRTLSLKAHEALLTLEAHLSERHRRDSTSRAVHYVHEIVGVLRSILRESDHPWGIAPARLSRPDLQGPPKHICAGLSGTHCRNATAMHAATAPANAITERGRIDGAPDKSVVFPYY